MAHLHTLLSGREGEFVQEFECIKWSSHDALKYADSSVASQADACPDVHLDWVFSSANAKNLTHHIHKDIFT